MKVDVMMPKMGESLQEGTIVKWLKNEGDKVERDEMILEISTDKVDTEIPSPQSGVLTKILAKEEEVIEVGEKIAEIETEAEEAAAAGGGNESPDTEEKEEETKAQTEAKEEPESEPEAEDTEEEAEGDVQDLIMPKMGESLQEGTITKWLKKPGDKVERDEMILEISTDKVDTEVPSPVGGILKEILAEEEETVEVGSVIGKIQTSGSPKKAVAKKEAPKEEPKKEAAAAEPKTQTATESKPKQQPASVNGKTFDIPRKKEGHFFSPLVRNIAEDEKVSLEELMNISGSGIDGRVTKEDLLEYIESRGEAPSEPETQPQSQPQAQAESQPSTAAPKPAASPGLSGGDSEVIKMDRMRQLISEHMIESKKTSAHVTSVAEVDVTGIVNFREKNKAAFQEREGIKLTYTPFFAKALIEGIKQFPMVNVSVDGKNIIKHNRLNLGIATALPDGNLIVPVIKNADNYGLTGLQRSITDLATRARNKKLQPDEVQDGTITLTNVGTFGTLFGTPVINQPQVAIIGVGAIKKRPVVKEVDGSDAIVIRQMMNCSITYDHRVVDGMLAGQTLKAICDALESMNEDTINL